MTGQDDRMSTEPTGPADLSSTPDAAAPAAEVDPGRSGPTAIPDRRTLTDAREIRALAHPVRVALLDALRREGTLTATEAGDLLDESPANCSFHLRTLAKYGYVEEAPGGTGRQRPWRRAIKGLSIALDNPEAETTAAAHELSKHFRNQVEHQQDIWDNTWSTYPKPWRDAAFTFQGTTYLTADELTQVNREILAVVDRFIDRLDNPAQRPEGSMPVSVTAAAHPLPLSKRGN